MHSPVLCSCPPSILVWAMRGVKGAHQGCVGIREGEGGYRGMHVVIVGGGRGMAGVGPQDGVIAPHEARYKRAQNQPPPPTHESTGVLYCIPSLSPAHAPAPAPYDTMYTITSCYRHSLTCLTCRLSVEALHHAIVRVARGRFGSVWVERSRVRVLCLSSVVETKLGLSTVPFLSPGGLPTPSSRSVSLLDPTIT
jgi:hypothetical protein